jgi:hypothetical protein
MSSAILYPLYHKLSSTGLASSHEVIQKLEHIRPAYIGKGGLTQADLTRREEHGHFQLPGIMVEFPPEISV